MKQYQQRKEWLPPADPSVSTLLFRFTFLNETGLFEVRVTALCKSRTEEALLVNVPPVELSCPLLLKDNGPERVRLPAAVSMKILSRLSVSFEFVNLR